MRIAPMSDLHLEFDRDAMRKRLRGLPMAGPCPVGDDGHPIYGPDLSALKGQVDLVLAAGDIDIKAWGIPWLDAAAAYIGAPVVTIAGNHEFYGTNREKTLSDLREAADRTNGRVMFLENDRYDMDVEGERASILGATLWTDYKLFGEAMAQEAMRQAGGAMTDFRRIRADTGRRKWTPLDALMAHIDSREWMLAEVGAIRHVAPETTIITMTHHGVSPKSIAPHHARDLMSAAYASDLEAPLVYAGVDLVVHGHVHHAVDFCLGDMRVVTNPRGYIGIEHQASGWSPQVIETCGWVSAPEPRQPDGPSSW